MTMKSTIILFTLLSAFAGHCFDHQHSLYAGILKKYVKVQSHQSYVNYKSLQNSPADLNIFRQYLKSLSDLSENQYQSFTPNEKLAFLINAYNAFTIELIITHYPVKSIKDIGTLLANPWKKEFFNLRGEKRHLDSVEHEMIRQEFQEPRIHFSVVCASIGCPSLASGPFLASNLEEQFEEAANVFLTDINKNVLDRENTKLHLSMIFKWYGKDFEKRHQSVLKAITPYFSTEDQLFINQNKEKIEIDFLPYDWNLNEES